jgi:hypothetical protein
MTENAWLIEKADNEHPGCVVPGEALGVCDGEAPFLNRKRALWGPYDNALRFERRQDAEAAASVLVPEADTVAVCHTWGDVSVGSLAEAIEAMLHDKGAFRETLPMHLDQPKFRWIVRRDIERVIEAHIAANAGGEN